MSFANFAAVSRTAGARSRSGRPFSRHSASRATSLASPLLNSRTAGRPDTGPLAVRQNHMPTLVHSAFNCAEARWSVPMEMRSCLYVSSAANAVRYSIAIARNTPTIRMIPVSTSEPTGRCSCFECRALAPLKIIRCFMARTPELTSACDLPPARLGMQNEMRFVFSSKGAPPCARCLWMRSTRRCLAMSGIERTPRQRGDFGRAIRSRCRTRSQSLH